MSTDTIPAPTTPNSSSNPHVLWRQLVGLVLWTGLLALPAGGPLGAILCLTLGGVTFADAWKSGIYKQRDRKSFLNISPMAWGIAMALLFIVTYPAYLLNRNKLRTIRGTNAYFYAVIVIGGLVLTLFLLNLFGVVAYRRS